ncbi:hypothetical protein DD238_000778 [Peronospora effusa]|uniref:Uncharacterized protein n=1 Tax=Peronospora effusa TaxID=542832 RepID=A0A3M6VSN1_9STRA|nr:hypothetical protein DD238_000778 [Peronospora effusa]RQM17371.1 hypothetical protein DD237_001348 [Peronospora effusa]
MMKAQLKNKLRGGIIDALYVAAVYKQQELMKAAIGFFLVVFKLLQDSEVLLLFAGDYPA